MKFVILISGCAFLLLAANLNTQERPAKSYFIELNVETLSEKSAPEFHLRTVAGDTVSLAKMKGQIVILHFWATWCKPCRHEMPALEQLFRESRLLPVSILGISIDDKKDSLKIPPALKQMEVTFPITAAFSGTVPKAYWNWGIPVTYIIDQNGKFIGRLRGSRDWGSPPMLAFLRQLVKEYSQ
ncbi:MAG TPA: TlpA disulfide reductase family protein [bacterium]